uniref:NADH dehydrogenase subunit 4 n=1 Tax=Ophidion marginatum TaxID=1459852 RepID=UPI0028D08418|nr:NADH dehydrogenase subunit 4 [Ophidion marginatum]WMY90769.1 NADH dehydrogenase subunit 4 [Ophidion marginatum]
MLKVIIPTMLLAPTTWIIPKKWLWPTTLGHSLLIALISLTWLKYSSETNWTSINPYLAIDPLSAPLLVLTCWLLPLMILASQNHMQPEPAIRQRTYITLMISLQFFLILAFTATELILFYIMFESTLIPTLMLITRWGNQAQRLAASNYFLFYTMAGSLPLLLALFIIQNDTGTLSMLILQFSYMTPPSSYVSKIWWIACLLAFLVKLPLYGAHLWLPKAHVEAPIAGSMVLAAVLLKLGGYGMMRMMLFIHPLDKEIAYPFMVAALWGVVMTSMMCLRQTDLKSLIAYSSVSHMGLVASGIIIQTRWGFTGALLLMIAHGLTSSALFCLANTNYERTHSRTIKLTRGLHALFPLMSTWWFIATLSNLALPPLPNLMGELMIITSLFNWCSWTIILSGTGTLITALYSLYMFLMTQRGPLPHHLIGLDPSHSREHLLMFLHMTPLLILVMKPELAWAWMT